MDKIVGNTDMDAFQIGKMYFCKELGAPKVGKDVLLRYWSKVERP